MKQCLYIIHKSSTGSLYGIGTYVSALIQCARELDMTINVVSLYDDSIYETKIEYKGNVRYINFPGYQYFQAETQSYQANIGWLLKDLVDEQQCQNIFHFNRMDFKELAVVIKQNFSGKVILTMHYSDWGLKLLGNKKLLREIIAKPTNALSTFEADICNRFEAESDFMVNYCDKIIAISQHSYNNILDLYGVKEEKVTMIPNALEDTYKATSQNKRATLKRRFNFDDNEKIILYAGRLDAGKGVRFIIEAFKEVLKVCPNSRLVIAGSGGIDSLLKHSGDIWPKITFTGFLDKKVLHKIYTIADVGVIPSLFEEFGYVAIEMMMFKIPLIVSNTTGLNEIIDDGINGLHVVVKQGGETNKKIISNIANKMILILNNNDISRKLSSNARKKFLQKYQISNFRHQLDHLYRDLF